MLGNSFKSLSVRNALSRTFFIFVCPECFLGTLLNLCLSGMLLWIFVLSFCVRNVFSGTLFKSLSVGNAFLGNSFKSLSVRNACLGTLLNLFLLGMLIGEHF